MVLELKDKLESVGVVAASGASATGKPAPTLSDVEQDVLSALVNLGCNRAAAEGAVRKAKAAGIADDFEPLFRRSLELVR
jgi:Holliday junction DNA helicase RuvA